MGIRTTVTLDEDVLEKLKQESHARRQPIRQVLNESLRKALNAAPAPKREFRVTPFLSGLRQDLNYDNIQELFDQLDGPASR